MEFVSKKNKRIDIVCFAVIILIGVALALLGHYSSVWGQDIRDAARRASVQTVFHCPVLRVSFTTPLAKKPKVDVEKLLEEKGKELEEKIADAIESYKKQLAEDKYEYGLTDIDKWGYEPVSHVAIPLGAFAPKWAKFPDKVLVAAKVEKKEISPWKKEYQEDVLTISETANVSPATAKKLLSNLQSKGYSISKEEISKSEEIELLMFRTWDDAYPTTLNWKVTTVGSDTNLIVGYDPRGILEIKPVGEDAKLHIFAGYFDLQDKFKEEPQEVKDLRKELASTQKSLEDAVDEANKLRDKLRDKKVWKRDISKATWLDVKFGTVKLEQLYFLTTATGVFIGNMAVNNKMVGYPAWRGYGYYVGEVTKPTAGVILTNAHVASVATSFDIMVSKDKEVMYIIYPGAPFVRYTKNSDYFGSPAWVLGMDGIPVISWGADVGIMLTTAVPGYETNKAVLGDSDNVKPGDRVVTVGNPGGMQKFTTEGVISNTKYSILDSLDGASVLEYVVNNGPMYNWMLHSNFWIDTSIGMGGVSGSPVLALGGPEKGKVVALRNMGMVNFYNKVSSVAEVDPVMIDYSELPDTIAGTTEKYVKVLFSKDLRHLKYSESFKNFLKDHKDLANMLEQSSRGIPISGMNGCIPINRIKTFLQERGLDPDHFGWGIARPKYWTQ